MQNIGSNLKKNKKVFILGASSDIGIKTTQVYLNNNWKVFAHYNQNKKELENIKDRNLKLIKFDLKKIKNFRNFTNKAKFLKTIDSFISLTGYLKPTNFSKININSFYDHINVNYLSNLFVLQKILPNMSRNYFGRILFSSSTGIKFGGGKETPIYSLTKYMNEFFLSTYYDYFKNNVLINTIRIGVTDTKIHKKIKNKDLKKRINLIPIKRMASSDEVAKYLYFYGSEKNTLTTKSIIDITGGE